MTPHQPKKGPLSWFSALNSTAQTFLGLGAFAAFVAAGAKSCTYVASVAQLEEHAAAEESVDREQDEDLDLLFQTTVKLTTDGDWMKREISGVREDLRKMDRGLPLAPLPTPTPTPPPVPVQTSAIPVPTPTPPTPTPPAPASSPTP